MDKLKMRYRDGKKGRRSLLSALFLMICLLAAPVKAEEASLRLHMLDVGQGLSILAESNGHYMLIDGGGGEASSYVVSYLQKQGVSTLDYIVATHYDEEHINGIIGALHVFGCGTILSPDYEADTKIYSSYLSAAKASGAQVIHPSQGDSFSLGKADICVVGPVTYDYEDENNRSVAVRITCGQTSCLISGDAESQSEEDMVNSGVQLASDLYVAGHHGSSTSSSEYFLDAVSPSYVWISCGADNSYGHPTEKVMERLQERGCRMFRTDKQGTVTASSDGESFAFDQDPCQDWSAGKRADEGTDKASDEGTDRTADEADKAPDEGADRIADGADRLSDEENDGITDVISSDAGISITYICNTNTMKFHYESCGSVKQMNESNKKYTNESRDSLIAQGYVPCKNCNP